MLYNGIEYPVFRASLHNHTTSSDGRFTVAELAGLFHDAGYDVFAVSDHRVPNDVSNINIPGLTVISGIELHPMGPRGILWHILALDVPKDFKGIYDTGKEAVDAAKAVGALVYAAHPRWCGLHVEEILELGELNGIEIDNSGCRLIGRAVNDEIWDELLDAGARPCHALATDDCHDWNCFAQGWTMIAAEENTHDCIMDALRKGRFYATQGPDFHSIEFRDGHFRATFSEAVSAVVVGSRDLGVCGAMPRWPMPGCERAPATSIEADVSSWPKGSWLRCQICDANHHYAWTQPFFV